jgi:hypothetical protein
MARAGIDSEMIHIDGIYDYGSRSLIGFRQCDDPLDFYEQPEVAPQVSHLRQVPLRIRVKSRNSSQLSPRNP